MGKFGWDLPPGCKMSDIPGNSPEDQRNEALMEKIYEIFDKSREQQMTEDERAELIFKLCGEVYQEGYNQGLADEGYAAGCDDAGESI